MIEQGIEILNGNLKSKLKKIIVQYIGCVSIFLVHFSRTWLGQCWIL